MWPMTNPLTLKHLPISLASTPQSAVQCVTRAQASSQQLQGENRETMEISIFVGSFSVLRLPSNRVLRVFPNYVINSTEIYYTHSLTRRN